MSSNVLVVDYGVGNIRSVCRAFEYCGADVKLSDNPKDLENADRVVLPGVGAISHCMEELKQRAWAEPLAGYTETERPFLGICVGMQMMMDVSWEFSECSCFGWISGEVIVVPHQTSDNHSHKIPHIGWSTLDLPDARDGWQGTILDGITPEEAVYFVHSFMAQPRDEVTRLADTRYDGVKICAAISQGAISGTQFHPEKSGAVGLRIIENFLAL